MSGLIELLTKTDFAWAANHTIVEFLAGYVFGSALIIGAPSVFLLIAFMSALQRTKGAQVGYKDHKDMPNPNQLYEDLQKLDDLYEELLWHPDDELQFTHDGEKIIITNKTLEKKQ